MIYVCVCVCGGGGGIMSKSVGCSVKQKDIMSTLGDTMIHVEDIMSTSVGVQYIGGIS